MNDTIVSFKAERKLIDGLDALVGEFNSTKASRVTRSELIRLLLGWAANNPQDALKLLAANQVKEALLVERILKSRAKEKSLAPTSKTAAEEDETR